MYEFFVYDYAHQDKTWGKPQRICAVFCASAQMTDDALEARLKDHFSTAIPPDAILLIGTAGNAAAISQLAKSPRVILALPAMTRYVGPPALNAFWITKEGKFTGIGDNINEYTSAHFLARLFQEGLMRIFKDREGMLDSLGQYHYVKPSGKHSDKFIRTANVLMRGAEVSFIAFSLLPYMLHRNITHIYTDTAAINAVAYALVALRQSFDTTFEMPMIDSFSSYSKLKSFRFEGTEESLVLISASTSHELELELMKLHQIPQEQIVTIYYLGRRQPTSQVVCDLTKSPATNPEGFDPIVSFPHDDCGLCQQGLLAIRIAGDQFLPENPKVISQTLQRADAPEWLSEFMETFVGKGVISCHRPGRTSTPGREHELYLDLKSVLDEKVPETDFHNKMNYLLRQATPASLQRVIYLDDPASKMLAGKLSGFYRQCGKMEEPKVVSATDVNSNLPGHILSDGTTVVVGSCIVSGRSLLAISQALRQIQTNNSIQYLVGVARTNSNRRMDEIRRNVQYGQYGARDHRFDIVSVIYLPDERPSPWAEERAFLLRLRDAFGNEPNSLRMIDERIEELDSGGTNGLQNGLFWRTVADGSLKLSPNFAFWEFNYDDLPFTQAEVYLTISAVLHQFRSAHGKASQGTQVDYHRVILSPRNFDRFNDGVIQASLLRAAIPWELDYSIEKESSGDMKRILESILHNRSNQRGEALLEFLLALASGKLRLTKEDERDFVSQLRAADLKTIKLFADMIENRVA